MKKKFTFNSPSVKFNTVDKTNNDNPNTVNKPAWVYEYYYRNERKTVKYVGTVPPFVDSNRFDEYVLRVETDNGTIANETDTLSIFTNVETIYGTLNNHKLIWSSSMGYDNRDASPFSYITKGYSADIVPNDLYQEDTDLQPIIMDIVPSKNMHILNQNNDTRFLNHPTITFQNNEAWTVTTTVNYNGIFTLGQDLFGKASGNTFSINVLQDYFTFTNSTGNSVNTNSGLLNKIVGKNIIITLVATGNNLLKIYINGAFNSNLVVPTNFIFERFLSGNNGYHYGRAYSYFIKSGAATPTQIQEEYTMLRNMYAEMESTLIGSQIWTTNNSEITSTPMGNYIEEVTLNAKVEKILDQNDRDFSLETTGNWQTGYTTSELFFMYSPTLSAATLTNYINNESIYAFLPIANQSKYKWVKASARAFFPSYVPLASIVCRDASGYSETFFDGSISSAWQVKSIYRRVMSDTGLTVEIRMDDTIAGGIIYFDDVTVTELGWENSTELYNYIYDITSGTTEEKAYAALKEAAMYCYYNNNNLTGATYGKLYNWYAVKLLDMDITQYNINNPTTPWNWRISTDLDWSTLDTTISGNTDVLKESSNLYWMDNTGTNTTNFTALPAGFRDIDGTFGQIYQRAYFWNVTNPIDESPKLGMSLRMIKT